MVKSTFKPSLSCQNRTIAYFYSQIEQQKQVRQRVQAILPEMLAKQVRHCLIKDKKLLVYTDSAAWASQLRFYNKAILASIVTLSREPIETMQIKIMTEQAGGTQQPQRKANLPSSQTIEIIRTDSINISDNQLKLALQRLSSTLKRLASEAEAT